MSLAIATAIALMMDISGFAGKYFLMAQLRRAIKKYLQLIEVLMGTEKILIIGTKRCSDLYKNTSPTIISCGSPTQF